MARVLGVRQLTSMGWQGPPAVTCSCITQVSILPSSLIMVSGAPTVARWLQSHLVLDFLPTMAVSSTSTRPLNLSRPDKAIAVRYLWSIVQAVW